jgi:hypothetical protein
MASTDQRKRQESVKHILALEEKRRQEELNVLETLSEEEYVSDRHLSYM